MSASTLVFFICLFVGCTTLPMTIDLLRVFLPRALFIQCLFSSKLAYLTSDHLAAVQPHVRRGDALGKAFGA